MALRPGGELAARPLHFIWICDCSGSMGVDGKIQALNTAIREAIPPMQKATDENPNAEVLVRAIKFSNGAQWHIAQATPALEFRWSDLTPGGETDLGQALKMTAAEMANMPPRGLPPVLVLISDGQPTDDFNTGLQALLAQPWGKKAVRVAIAIGEDADLDVLQAFIANPEIKPLRAHSPEALMRYIQWVSTAVLQSASAPPSQTTATGDGLNVPLPEPPQLEEGPTSAIDVW